MNAASLDQLSPDEKRALLRRLLAERAASGAGDYSLAYGQRALWFLQRLLPDSSAYNVAFSARIEPAIELEPFRRALEKLVSRHPALRTVFPENDDGQALQRVRPSAATPLRVLELSDASDDELYDAVVADYQTPFDLDTGLVAVTLYRRRGYDVLLVNVHHLVFDAWSLQIFFEDLRAFYEAELTQQPPALSRLTAQYKDFVAEQSGMLESERGEALWDYWRKTLDGIPTTLDLSTANPRSGALTMGGATLPFVLTAEHSAALHALARQQRTTLYTVMLAAMQAMLHQFSGQSEIVVGTPVSMRSREDFQNVIGYFINMVPIRGSITADEPFLELLARTRQNVLGALEHQEFPFPLLVDRLRIQRDPRWNPIFQTMLNVNLSPRGTELSRLFAPDATAAESVRFGESKMTPFPIPQQEGQFEIVIEMTDSDGVLHGNFKYQIDRFSDEAARELRDTFAAMLVAIAERPDACVADLAVVPSREDFEL